MNRSAALFCLLFFSLLLSFVSVEAIAEELDLVNRPINATGLTGLLVTTAPYTLPPKTVEIGAAVLYESSIRPDYSVIEFPLILSVGVGTNMEIGLRGSYYSLKEGPTTTAVNLHGIGDIQLSYKWNFMPQAEYSRIPGLSLLITGIFPVEDDVNKKLGSVMHWGLRAGLSTGTELSWKEHILGIYADAQVAGQDLTENRLQDIYGIFNAGLLLPISKYQNLQILAEYSIVNGKNRLSLTGGDYTALTFGIRLVSERFNLTMGTQYLHKQVENYDNSSRVIGLMSMKF
jgi:hypothetical protein